jgi:hypothetical protein
MPDRGGHEEEEGREQDLFRRNELGHNMAAHEPNGATAHQDHGKLCFVLVTIPMCIAALSDEFLSVLLGLGPATGAASGLQPGEPGARNGKASPEKTKGVRRYFSKKPEKRREEATPWEQSGDEDLVGDVKGKCGTKRLFWKGSLDSQGCPTASAAEVKDIFRHIILVSMSIAILSPLVRNLCSEGFVDFVAFYRAMFTEVDRWAAGFRSVWRRPGWIDEGH